MFSYIFFDQKISRLDCYRECLEVSYRLVLAVVPQHQVTLLEVVQHPVGQSQDKDPPLTLFLRLR